MIFSKKNYFFILIFFCFSFFAQANNCLNEFTNKKITNESLGVLDPKIFRGNDIRGVFLKDFDFSFPATLGKALVSFSKNKLSLDKQKILIGYDARLSGPKLTKNLEEALIKQGADVAVVGLIPTPLAYFLLHHYDYTATVIVTASHNPVEYNGFKIMFNNKYEKYNVMSDIKKIIEDRNFINDKPKKSGNKIKLDPYTPYIESLKKEFPHLKPTSFVVDTGNGAAGPLAKKVFKALGLKPHYLYTEPNGTFPNHHPDPTKEMNLVDLKKEITKNKSLFGVGFDGDGDRLVIVTDQHKSIKADEFAYMFLPSLLNYSRAYKLLLADVKVSNWYFKEVEKKGAYIEMVKSGYGFLREHMRISKASFAMEFSGHIMFNDRVDRGFDDALYNTLRFIELIGGKKGVIEKLLPQVTTVRTNEIRLKLDSDRITKALKNLKTYLDKKKEEYISIDGIRITRGDSWGLVRYSQTESVLSLRFEAPNKEIVLNLIKELSAVMEVQIPEDELKSFL